MSTKFSYWFLKNLSGKPFPKFLPPSKPKEYLTTWFDEKVSTTGTFPVAQATISMSELIEAGLAAGYGKESTWSRSLLLGKQERAALYSYLRTRLQATYECLDVSGNGVALKSFWHGIEPSEKAGLSFAVGSVGALVAARRWVQQYDHKRTVKRFLHARVFVDAAIARYPLGKPATGESMPDFFAEDSAGEWHVFEAKGGDQGNRWKQLAQGIQQAQRVKRVGPAGAVKLPRSAVCVHALVARDSKLELTLVDPPPETGHADGAGVDDVHVVFLPSLLELGSVVDSIEWFYCLRDSPLDDEFATLGRLQDDSAAAWSGAFGGIVLSLPSAYLREEANIREAARTLTTLTRLLDDMDDFDPFGPDGKAGQQLAREARTRLNTQDHAIQLDSDALLKIESAASTLRQPDGLAWMDWFARELPVGNLRIGELVDSIELAHRDAERAFNLARTEDLLQGTRVITSGGLAVWVGGPHTGSLWRGGSRGTP